MMKIKNFRHATKSRDFVHKKCFAFLRAKNPGFLSMNKKAQGLSITTVVVAILAILVLVVLFYIFTTQTGGLTRQLITCPGTCDTGRELCELHGGTLLPGTTKYLDPQGRQCVDCCSVRIAVGTAE